MPTRPTFTTIDQYIASFPTEVQAILEKIRKIIATEVPEAVETISYGIPTFKLNGKFVVYFAGFKHHVSLYPIPNMNAEFEKRIQPFIKGKGTVQFQLKDPIPYDLIKEFVKLAHQTNLERTQSKK